MAEFVRQNRDDFVGRQAREQRVKKDDATGLAKAREIRVAMRRAF